MLADVEEQLVLALGHRGFPASQAISRNHSMKLSHYNNAYNLYVLYIYYMPYYLYIYSSVKLYVMDSK